MGKTIFIVMAHHRTNTLETNQVFSASLKNLLLIMLGVGLFVELYYGDIINDFFSYCTSRHGIDYDKEIGGRYRHAASSHRDETYLK